MRKNSNKKNKDYDISSTIATYVALITVGIIFIRINDSSLFFYIGLGLLLIAVLAGSEELKQTGIEMNYVYFMYIGIAFNVASIFLWDQINELGRWLEQFQSNYDWLIVSIKIIFLLLMFIPIFTFCNGLIGTIRSIISNENNKENVKMLIGLLSAVIAFATMMISIF